ncbi:MAG: hypothetical protein CL454_00585 [Acidimicrobiaceae bacterium]|nr:hypothetical protein [Acidimicrobiaceae bacterium]
MKILPSAVPTGSTTNAAPNPKAPIRTKRKYDAVAARRTRRINKERALQGKPPLKRQRKTNRKYVYSGRYVKDASKARRFKGVLGQRMQAYQKNLSSDKVSSWLKDAETKKEKGDDRGVHSKVCAKSERSPPVEV